VKTLSKKAEQIFCLACWNVAYKESKVLSMDYYCPHCGFAWDFILVNDVLHMMYNEHEFEFKRVPLGCLAVFKEVEL
jgi:hypothetical protein